MSAEMNTAGLLGERPTAELGKLRNRGLVIAVVGVAAAAFGFMQDTSLDHSQFFQSYLVAYMFWMGITLGSLGLLMLQYLSGGAWGLVSRRIFEAATRNLPLMAVMFIPIALNIKTLYRWSLPEAASDPIIHDKAGYLNEPFFLQRAAGYFLIWGILMFLYNRWSAQQDSEPAMLPGPKHARMRVLAGPGMVLFFLTVTLMSVDWVMSLDPHWYSTIFGILTIGGMGLSTLAFTILILAALSRSRPMSDFAVPERFHDLGKLMLAFVMLWAYFNISQLLIIWSANLPEEIPWYIERLRGLWAPVAVFVLLGHFVLPFLLLLSRDLKRRPHLLKWIALFILVMRVVDIVWTIGPVFRKDGVSTFNLHWLDFATVIGLGGIWLTLFAMNLGARAIVPANDPYFKEAVAHGGH